jgi:hypothetical protein
MALTRKFLAAFGIEADKIEEIITAHTETVNALKEQINENKIDANELKTLKDNLKAKEDELKEANKKIKAFEESAWEEKANEWEQKYNDLKTEYDGYKTDIETQELKNTKVNAYKKLLKEAGVSEKRIDSVIKVSDIESISIDKDGNIKDADKLIESVKEEWSDFITATSQQGANTATPPANNGGSTRTKEEIMAIKDRAERQKAIAENPSLFGITE